MSLPNGPMLAPEIAVANMLADCYWWRGIVDPNNPWDEATARAHIHGDGLPPPDDDADDYSKKQLEALRPFALVWNDPESGYTMQASSHDHCCPMMSGQVNVQIELNTPEELGGDMTAIGNWARIAFGRLLYTKDAAQPGLWDLNGGDNYLYFHRLSVNGPWRSDEKQLAQYGDSVFAEFELHWGLDR